MTSAIASRVMSSCVGPRPPHMITPSDRASAVRSARRSGRGCPRRADGMAGDPGRGELLAEPLRVGVGDLTEEQLGADRDDLDPHALATAA